MRDSQLPDLVRPPRIVIVDDEPCLLEMTEILIRSWFKEATILTFGDPEEALEELRRADPDVLITDDMMPGLTGYDIIQSLMDRNTAYPILLVSGMSGTETWVQEHAGYGLNISFLPKPFTVEQLKGWLDAHLGQEGRP